MSEKDYINGSRTAYRRMMQLCLREIIDSKDNLSAEEKVVQLAGERDEALAVLRRICEEHGDNDWDNNLHLADIIDKHLGRHLDG